MFSTALHLLMYSLAGNRNFARKNYISQPLPPMLFSSPEAALLLVSTKNRDLWLRPMTFRFEWLCRHDRLRPELIRFVRLNSEHAQSDGKSVNRGLPVLDLARGRGLVEVQRSRSQFEPNIMKKAPNIMKKAPNITKEAANIMD